ncbi:MAG TPA: lysylphosphatidylglycerol synthase domain-containing protein [Chitinophagaceae bacterium]|nr:lysylphosphatidylglycerol synthase domain-containing protein [Chitinophagaceae bacterium]
MKPSKNTKLFINYLLGPVLFVWLAWSIYRQIQQQPGLEAAWQQIKASVNSPMIGNLIAVVLLMLVNWSLEAVKWKISVSRVQQVSFTKSLRAVFSGVSFSVSTPNRIGEYLGRVLYMEEGNRLKTIALTIVGSISQLIITLFMGLAGLLVLRSTIEEKQLISPLWMQVIIYGVAAVLVVLTLFYFRLSWIIKWADRLPGSGRYAYLVKALEEFNATILLKLLSLSLLRFGVFLVQYLLLFNLFAVEISWWQAFWTVSVSFLVMAVIPTIAIAELAQRGKVTITIVGLFSSNELGMTFATAGIWFINLILPAVIGSLLIVRMRKIFTINKQDDAEN